MGKVKEAVLEASLSERLENERICFSMACNIFVLQSADSEVVKLKSGEHARVPIRPIRIARGNPDDVSGRTRYYDRYDPTINDDSGLTDAEILAYVFDKLERHPGWADNVNLQLKVHGETEPVIPWPGYDTMPVEGLKAVVENSEYDLLGLMKYELEVRPTMTDSSGQPFEIREEVVDMLNEVAADRALTQIVDAEQGVQGL